MASRAPQASTAKKSQAKASTATVKKRSFEEIIPPTTPKNSSCAKPKIFSWPCNICGTVIKGTTALRLSQDRGSHMSYRHSDVPGNTLASSLSATPWRLSCRVGIAPCVQLVFPSWDRLKRSSRSGTILPQSTKNVTPPSPGAVTKARIARYSKDPKSEPRIRDRIRKTHEEQKARVKTNAVLDTRLVHLAYTFQDGPERFYLHLQILPLH